MLESLAFSAFASHEKLAGMSIHEAIKSRRKALGMSMQDLADAVSDLEQLPKKLGWQTVQQWENEKSAPKRTRLSHVATALKTTVNDLLGEDVAATEDDDLPRHQLRNQRPVWVVGRTQGGMPERIWDDGDHPVGMTDEFADVSTSDQHAFACRVVGESMAPRYMPGEYALVEPDTPPDLEDDVLVRLVTGETMLKRLLSRRGGIRLGSYNTTEVLSFQEDEISWMYYVAHPIPLRRIKHRI